MENVTFVKITDPVSGDVSDHAVVDQTDGSFASMPKSVYDEMIAAQANQPTL